MNRFGSLEAAYHKHRSASETPGIKYAEVRRWYSDFVSYRLPAYFGSSAVGDLVMRGAGSCMIQLHSGFAKAYLKIRATGEAVVRAKVDLGAPSGVKMDAGLDETQSGPFICGGTFPMVHYIPASRSWIMRGWRVLAAGVVSGSPLTGGHLPASGQVLSVADAQLIARLLALPDNELGGGIPRIADMLEERVLGGRVKVTKGKLGVDVMFSVGGQLFDVAQAPASVAELAPLILSLRYFVREGDILVLEEPEAHLHPKAVREVAKALARLSNLGVKVMITTHSDYLLAQLSNFVVAGGVRKERLGKTGIGMEEALSPDTVGAYLFRRGRSGSVAAELKVSGEGIPLDDFNRVNDELYSEHVGLSYSR